jgi:hypothetical protein
VHAERPAVDAGEETEEATLIASESTLFTARLDPRTGARQGQTVELAVDPARFHFFHVETGAALVGDAAAAVEAEPVEPAAVAADDWS